MYPADTDIWRLGCNPKAVDGLRLCECGTQWYWKKIFDMGGWSQVSLAKIISTNDAGDYSIVMCKKLKFGIATK